VSAVQIDFEESTHTYRVNGTVLPSVTQILEFAGISDFSGVPAEVLARAQKRGTAVHNAAWYDDQNDLDESTLDPTITGYLTAWRKFKAENGVTVKLIEQRVYSPLGFVGTFDRLIEMPKWGEVMPDLKTGEESPSWRIQLAAYLKGFHGPQAPKCRRVAVKLRKDGTYSLCWYEQKDLTRDWNVFASALTVFQYRKANGLL
jgi:hypothetical protein